MKIWIGKLQQNPALTMIRDAHANIWKELQKNLQYSRKPCDKSRLICITSQDFPSYRLLDPAKYVLIRDTLAWGLKKCIIHDDKYRSVSIELQMPEDESRILMGFSEAGIRQSKSELLPFQTRLANLGIYNEFVGNDQEKFVLFIPIVRQGN